MSPEQVKSLTEMRFGTATADKMKAIQEAKAYKTLKLEKFQQTISAATERSDANKNSWVGQLGLSPDSVSGTAVNAAANVYSGGARVLGDILTTATDAYTYANEGSVSEENIQRYNKYLQGKATPEDIAILNTETPSADGRVRAKNELKMATPMELIKAAGKGRELSSSIDKAFDQSSAVHQGAKDKLQRDIGADFVDSWNQTKEGYQGTKEGNTLTGAGNMISGAARLTYNAAEAIVTNPKGTFEYVAENTPQLAIGGLRKVGGKLLLASNMGYASDSYRKGIEKFQAENNGQYPSLEVRKEMAAGAIKAGAAEQVGDLVTGGLTNLKNIVKKPVTDIATTSFKDSLKNVLKATGGGVVTEGITEAYQTVQEGVASLTPATAKDIYTSGVIGAASGGTLSGGGRTLAEVAGATPEQQKVREVKAEKSAEFRTAAEANDPSVYMDKTKASYDPSMAVGVLYAHANLETTTPEVKAANLKQAGEIVASIEEQHTTLKERVDSYTPEAIQGVKDQIIQVQEAMKTADPSKVKTMQTIVDTLNEDLVARQDTKAKLIAETAFSKVDRQLNGARLRMVGLSNAVSEQVTPESVQSAVQEANSTPDVADTTAVESARAATGSVINLSMRADTSLSAKDALALSENTSNSLTSDERQHLKTFAEARQAQAQLQTMTSVSQAIMTGDGKNAGISTWASRMASAVATGNQSLGDKAVTGITKFADDHQAKFQAARAAMNEGEGASVQRINGNWVMVPAGQSKVSMKELRQQKGLMVDTKPDVDNVARFKKLVNALEIESYALNKTKDEISSAHKLKFGVQSISSANQTTSPVNKSSKQTLEPGTRPNDTNVSSVPTTPVTQKETSSSSVETASLPAEPSSTAVSKAGVLKAQRDAEIARRQKIKDEVLARAEKAKNEPDTTSVEQPKVQQTSEATAEEVVAEPVAATTESKAETKPDPIGMEAKRTPKGEQREYTQRNLVADYFVQSPGSDTGTQRPLAVTENFLSVIDNDNHAIYDFIQAEDVSPAQDVLLDRFVKVAKKWASNIKDNLKVTDPNYHYTDMIQFLMNKDGTLPENVQTAMSLAAFSWVAENATRPSENTNEEINAILLRDEDHTVTSRENEALINVGTRQALVVSALGQRAIAALGLKMKPDAPMNLQSNLEVSVGMHVLKLLMDQGVLTRTLIDGNKMKELTGNEDTKVDAKFFFINVARQDNGELNTGAAFITKVSTKTQGILTDLFGVEAAMKDPTTKPVKFTQETTRNTKQSVPSTLSKIMEKFSRTKNYVREDMTNLVKQIDDDTLLSIAGFQQIDNSVHVTKHNSIKAKNDGLVRELSQFKEYVFDTLEATDNGLEQAIYLTPSVWKQQRVGIATNTLNPQTSKIHRNMMTRENWNTEIDINDADQMTNFKLRVAEGMGVKTDKMNQQSALAKFDAMTQTSEFKAAVEVLQFTISGESSGKLNSEQQAALIAGTKLGGENMHSLSSLMAYAHYQQTLANKETKFVSQLMAEVDGVTNGPMLTNLLLGASSKVSDMFKLLNRGGFYQVDSAFTEYNNWRSAAGNFDLYETTASHMTDAVQRLDANPVIMKALYAFTGELKNSDGVVQKAGRDIVKTPLTAMTFGSSVYSAVDSMADKFIDSIYKSIEDSANGKQGAMTFEQITKNLKTLGVSIRPGTDLMQYELTNQQTRTLKSGFTDTLGEAVKSVMETDFAHFIEQRRQFNTTAQMAFEVYNAVYSTMRNEMIQELMDKGELAYKVPKKGKDQGKKIAIQDLTPAQDKVLRDKLAAITPVMNTAFSNDSSDSTSGLMVAKTDRKLADSAFYGANVKFGTEFNDGTGFNSASVNGFEVSSSGPGVAMLPMSIHSSDSHISHMSDPESTTLNIHDAKGDGVGNIKKTAEAMNKQTFETMLNYSPATEVTNALTRTVTGLASMIEKGEVSQSVIDAVGSAMVKFANKQSTKDNKVNPLSVLDMVLLDAKKMEEQANSIKLDTLAQMQSVNQYAMEGGAYAVTDENRSTAASLRSALVVGLSSDASAALTTIGNAIAASIKGDKTVFEATNNNEMDQKVTPTPDFAEQGQPASKVDKALEAMFGESKVIPVSTVIGVLQGAGMNEYSNRLLAIVTKVLQPGLSVRMVTEDNISDVLEQPKANSRAWYVSKDGQHEINVMGSSFVNSGLTPEVLLHELTHAALARTIDQAERDGKGDAFTLVQELEQLRTLATDYAKANGTEAQFSAALSSVQELVAWGMTNKEFQDNVLAKVQMESKTSTNKLVDGMKAFIERITSLLFGKTTPVIQNGMTVLVSNVSGLFKAAAETKATNTGTINQSMTTNPDTGLNNYSTTDIYDSLQARNNSGTQVSAQHDQHLRNILNSIVSKLYGPFGSYKAKVMTESAVTPEQVYTDALATGLAPHASEAIVAGIHFTQEESYVFDQTEAVISQGLNTSEGKVSSAYRELNALFNETRDRLKAKDFHDGDWNTATANEKQIAEDKYAFIFNITPNARGVSDHLARFAAMGLAHEQFNTMLKVPTAAKPNVKATTIQAKLQKIWEAVLDFIAGQQTNTRPSQDADAKLFSLVQTLAQIEQRKVTHLIVAGLDVTAAYDMLDTFALNKRAVIRKQITKFANKPAFKTSGSGFIRGASGLASTYGGYRVKYLLESFERFRNSHFKGQQGVTAGVLNELRGAKDLNVVYHFLLRQSKLNEGNRKDLITGTGQVVMGSFTNNGENLTDVQKHALTQVVLRADLHSLLKDYSFNQVTAMITNPGTLRKEIATKEAELTAQGNKPKINNFFMNSAKAMAYRMVTGKATNGHTLMNAGVIARMYGTGLEGNVSTAQAEAAETVIDTLGSLYALSYVDSKHMNNIRDILTAEQSRTDGGNGVEMLMQTHKMLQDKAKATLFANQDNDALFMKGYLPEVYDPYMAYVVANEADGKDLLAQGYKKSMHTVPTDAADPSSGEVRHFYSLRDGGLKPWLSGVFSYTGQRAKGTRVQNGNLDVSTYTGQVNANLMNSIGQAKQSQIKDIFNNTNFDPSTVKDTFLVPLLNSNGDVVNHRYMMEDRTKDTLLDRDNRPEKLLGILAGNIYDKPVAADQNRKGVQALKSQYDFEYAERAESYLELGPRSADPQLREIYNMLPTSTKDAIREIWGTDTMMVRNDVLDLNFGYRKLSIADAFTKDAAQRTFVQNMFVELGTYAFGQKAPLRLRQGEDVWQAFVKLTKANLVVRSIGTLTGNLRSNWSQLLLAGVTPQDIMKHHRVAFKGAWEYNAQSKELFNLEHQLSTGYIAPGNNKADMEYRVAQLKESIARNPVKPLIDAGLMPTIVEDVSEDADQYTYKSKLTKRVEGTVSKFNPKVVNVAKGILMTEDSTPYKVMSFSTQISDFLARYTLYEHMTNREVKPMSHNEAVQFASDAFINYDIPTHRMMQYANDSGLMMFTKYYIRIQKMIGKIFKDNPGRAMALIAAEHFLGDQPTVLDSSMLVRFGNPMNLGALDFPGSLDDIATVRAITSPFR